MQYYNTKSILIKKYNQVAREEFKLGILLSCLLLIFILEIKLIDKIYFKQVYHYYI